jgi:hypothetical protein
LTRRPFGPDGEQHEPRQGGRRADREGPAATCWRCCWTTRSTTSGSSASRWGFEQIIHRTLDAVRARAGDFGLPADAVATIVERADALTTALAAASKTVKWRMRARVGERKRW